MNNLQEQARKFNIVTLITVEQALTFFLAAARFPNAAEITAIRHIGIDHVVHLIQIGESEKLQGLANSLLADLDKLESAKSIFWETCKDVLRKFTQPFNP